MRDRGPVWPVSGGEISSLERAAAPVGPASRWVARVRPRLAVGGAPDIAAPLLADVRWTVVFVAFLGYIFAITTYRLPIGNLAMVVGLTGLAVQREPFRIPPLIVAFGAFILFCAVSYVLTPYPDAVWSRLIDMAKLWLVALVGVNALRSYAQIRVFLVFFLGCFALFPLRGALFNYFLYQSTVFGRAIWNYVYSNPNDLAALAILQLSLVGVILAAERQRWIRRAAQVGIVLLPLLILMTQSRGGFIALFVVSVACIVGQWRHLRKVEGWWRRWRVMGAVFAALAIAAVIAPRGVWDRMHGLRYAAGTEQLAQVDQEGSARQRFEIWKVAAKIIREHPLTGIGVGAYPLAHAVYARGEEFDQTAAGVRDTHSTILNVLAETGIPGLIAFLTLVGTVVVAADRVRRRSKLVAPHRSLQLFFLEIGLLGLFTAGVFGSFAHLSFLYVHLVLLWALSEVTRSEIGA